MSDPAVQQAFLKRGEEIERLTAEVARLEHDLLALNFEEVVWLRAEVVRLKAEAVADGVLIADLQTGLARVLRQRVYALRTIGRLRDERVATITQNWVAAKHWPSNSTPSQVRCHAGKDGECYWLLCPQERDGEPQATGRDCPIANWDDDE